MAKFCRASYFKTIIMKLLNSSDDFFIVCWLYCVANISISSLMNDILRSLWNVWLPTYQGNIYLLSLLSVFDWNFVVFHNPIVAVCVLYIKSLLVSESLDFPQISRYICRDLRSSYVHLVSMCFRQLRLWSKWNPRYLISILTRIGE